MPKTANGASPPDIDNDETIVVEGDVTVLQRAAVRCLHARDLNAQQSAIGVVRAGRTTLAQSSAGVVAGRSVACDEVRVGILASPVVRGEVHTLIDLRSAFAIGLGMALGRALIAGGRGLAARRRS
jgi:hypothetical protein